MPPRVDSPVQTQLAIPVPDGVLGSGRSVSGGRLGRRRIFVQTDTGSVLGIELDRADNVQTVKKKMQTILNVPIEQTALMFGDTVLKSDLSKLRNDSPLLLTRELQRSLSTPCIFPPPDALAQSDGGQPFEVVGGLRRCPKMKKLLKEIVKAIDCGVEPLAVSGGLGGAYYFRNSRGESVAIVKPTDEEPFAPNNPKGFVGKTLGQPGLKRAVRVGETGVREVAAYLLDHDHFAKVPPTVLVKVSHRAFNVNNGSSVPKGNAKDCSPVSKIASCQQFVHHDFDASEQGASRFSVSAVHRIGILDIRIFNTDRHAGNILVRNARPLENEGAWSHASVHVNDAFELIPIDHGLCLPEALEDPYFEWLHWPQASVPFTEEEVDYIQRLDINKDVEMLRAELPMLREACLRVLILSTIVLKKGVAVGLCLAEIGEYMSRDGMEEESQLELLCLQAKLLAETELSASNMVDNDDDVLSDCSYGDDDGPEQFEFEMDYEDMAANGGYPVLSRRVLLGTPRSSYEEKGISFVSRKGGLGNGFADYSVLLSSGMNLDKSPQSYSLSLTSPKAIQRGQIFGRTFCEAPEELQRPVYKSKIPDSRASPREVECPVLQLTGLRSSSSEMRSPRGNHMDRSSRVRRQFCPLVEEEEVNVFAETNLNANIAACKVDDSSPRAKSYRSVSFSDRKQRYANYPERKGFGLPASETTGKGNTSWGSSSLSLGDMSDKEWVCFLKYFEDLLQEAFSLRSQRNANLKQRLGISCQF